MRSLGLSVLLLTLAAPALAQNPPTLPLMERAVVTPISPMFPEAERAKGTRNAEVQLELTIGPDGIVKNVRVVTSGGQEFDDAALVVGRLTVFAKYKQTTLQRFKVGFNLY